MAGPKISFRRRLPISGSLSSEVASGDGGNDRDLVLLVNLGRQPSTEAHVLVVQVYVDELAQLAGLIEQAILEARVACVQCGDGRREVGGLHVNGHLAVRKTAQRAGDAELRHLQTHLLAKRL